MPVSTALTAVAGPRARLPLLTLLTASMVSSLGSMMTAVALPWFVLETTGSPARAGATGFFVVLPKVLAGLFGGALIDRAGFKRTSVVADVVGCLGVGSVPLLYHTVGLAFWQLLACVFFGALLEIPGLTARRSLLPELAGLAGVRLESATAAYEANQYIALLLGAPLAGVLIAGLGASNVLWLDAASFAFSAVAVGTFIPSLGRRTLAAPRGSYRGELAAGLRFLTRDRVLRALAIGIALTNLLGASFFSVILPVYARDTYGSATGLGVLAGAIGAGSLAGAMLYGVAGHRVARRLLWLAGFLIVPMQFWALLMQPPAWILVATLALVGLAAGPLNPLLVTVRMERIPEALRGRVFSTFSAISTGLQPIGMLAGGTLVGAVGLRPGVLALALASQLVGIAYLFVPAFREMDRRPTMAPVAGDAGSPPHARMVPEVTRGHAP